jgi:hypothetical protein
MGEFLIAAVQGLCIFGLLCGGYFAIGYGADSEAAPARTSFDPVTTHSWSMGEARAHHART